MNIPVYTCKPSSSSRKKVANTSTAYFIDFDGPVTSKTTQLPISNLNDTNLRGVSYFYFMWCATTNVRSGERFDSRPLFITLAY